MTTDTIGDTSHNSTGIEGYEWAFPIIASASGALQSIGYNIKATGGSGTIILALYADSVANPGVRPGSKLAQTVSTVAVVGFNDYAATSTPSIVAGTRYWIAVEVYSTNGLFGYYYSASTRRYKAHAYGTFDDPWPTTDSGDAAAMHNSRMTYSAAPVYKSSSDTGSGVDGPKRVARTLPETGHGTDTLQKLGRTLLQGGVGVDAVEQIARTLLTEQGSGSETEILGVGPHDSDFGVGVDIVLRLERILLETGAGVDAPEQVARTLLPDFAAGVDAQEQVERILPETGYGVDATTILNRTVKELGSGVDALKQLKRTLLQELATGIDNLKKLVRTLLELFHGVDEGTTSTYIAPVFIDAFNLAHAQETTVSEPSILETVALDTGLPKREMTGKTGRVAVISGWTKQLAELEIIRGFNDEATHTLLLPTGDSFSVLIIIVTSPRSVEDPYTYDYTLTAYEQVAVT